jgi:tripartite-type tricarboxylate transporter receptor subunit TctC
MMTVPGPAASAQDLPRGTITLVVPFAPGSVTDALARTVAPKMGELLGRAVIVENKPGAGTVVGTVAVAKAAPDGRTLLVGGTALVVNAALQKDKLPYDPLKDFAPVTLLATSKSVLVANPSLGVKTLAELVALLKAKPGAVNYASAGSGNMTHLGVEIFKAKAGVDIMHVPYRGANPAVTDVLAGHASLLLVNPGAVEEHIKAGKLLGLAVTGEKRLASLPDVPTFAEGGVALPELDFGTWFGVLAPAGTPPALVATLNDAIVRALKAPEVEAKLRAIGFEPEPGTPEAYAAMLRAQLEQWPPIIEKAGIKVE